MKSILMLMLMLVSFSSMARPQLADLDLDQLKADKAVVLKAEAARLQKMLGTSRSVLKSKVVCPEPDVIIIDKDPTGVDTYCEARWLDGTCRTYGSDKPGTCYPYCEARWLDGTCRTWGADVCQ